jgi:CCR4-NOT transcriptional regulation complex NOT5 subunit
MNKKLIIIGVLGLAGAGAFFYFKSKNKLGKNDTPSSAGGLVPTSGTSVLPTSTTSTTTTPTSTLSVPPTQSSVTIGEVTLTTPVQVVETAIKIAEAKNIATQILNLRNQKNRYDMFNTTKTKKSFNDYAIESGNQWWLDKGGGEQMLQMLLNQDLRKLNEKIYELDKTLALIGYTEINGSIQKI